MAKIRKWVGLLISGIALAAAAFMTTTRKRKKSVTTDLEATSTTDPNTPNILVIVVDDLDADTLQRMLDANKLPNIKSKIVDRSVNFRNAYVPCSICSPSRASLLTGKFTHNHDVWHVVGNEGPERFDDYLAATDNAYLPKWLSSTHYRAFVGKWHLGSRHPQWDYYRSVEGYDPRPGMYKANENGRDVWPNVYQTKYIGDAAKQAIASSGDQPFFLLIAPTPVHVNISGWQQKTNEGRARFTGTPVAFSQFPIDSDNWRQHLVTVDFATGAPVYIWWSRDSGQMGSGWGEWARTGDGATIAPNTGDGAVVGWNILLPEPNIRRQQLVRQTGPDVEFYSRDIEGEAAAGAWSLVADESTLAGTGSKPVVGWSAVVFPSGIVRQQVVRGSETLGYISYMRHRLPSSGVFSGWRLDPDWGESVVFGRLCGFTIIPTEGARYVNKLILRRPGSANFEFWQSGELIDFQELAATGSSNRDRGLESAATRDVPDEGDTWLDPAMEFSPGGVRLRDKDTPASGEGLESAPAGSVTVVSEVHPYFLQRAYAEGSWSPIAPGQTYSYPTGQPAGSLRLNRDPNEYAPVSPQYDLPRNKPSFNRQRDTNLPFFSTAAWPDLNNPVQGGRKQQDYLRRLMLDRMEQLISLDRMVGEVLNAANSNTIVIFTSDNGHMSGEQRLSNKLTAQEESVRVPLYVCGPNVTPREADHLVANIDLGPTILDYAGRSWQNPVFNVDGRSLRQLIEGAPGRSWRRSLLLEYHQPRGLAGDRSATDWRFGLPDYLALRQYHESSGQSVNNVYVQYYADIADPVTVTNYEYYEIASDPYQTDNLAEGKIVELDSILRASYAASGDGSRAQDMEGLPPLA